MGANNHEQCSVPLDHRVSGLVLSATLEMIPLNTRFRGLSTDLGAQQSSCRENETPCESASPRMSIGVGHLDIRVCEFPDALRGSDLNWNELHILQFQFLISGWLRLVDPRWQFTIRMPL
jgi:hypothetical protein